MFGLRRWWLRMGRASATTRGAGSGEDRTAAPRAGAGHRELLIEALRMESHRFLALGLEPEVATRLIEPSRWEVELMLRFPMEEGMERFARIAFVEARPGWVRVMREFRGRRGFHAPHLFCGTDVEQTFERVDRAWIQEQLRRFGEIALERP